MPNLGDILYVKSSEEPVTFIAERPMEEGELGKTFPSHYSGPKRVYTVRRPIVSDVNGVSYKFFDFIPVELETAKEKAHRQLEDIKLRQALAMGEMALDQMDPKAVKN